MQQGGKFRALASAHLVGALKALFERQEALLPIVWGASIGVLDRLTLALRCLLFELVDDEGEEKGDGKDGDKEVDEQSDIRRDASPQALYPDTQVLPDPWWALAGIETA